MNRDDQIAKVEQGFKDLAAFAKESWSNLDIAARVQQMHAEVQKLYPPVVVPGPPIPPPSQPPEPPAPPPQVALRPGLPADFIPVYVDSSTRWP